MKILLAEDQSMLRDAMAQLLGMEDQIEQVVAVENGQVAIEKMENMSFDVVLLDVEMPLKTGLEVLEWIRQTNYLTKVIIFTTFKRAGYFQKAVKLGVDAYVLKERSISELMQTIDKVQKGQKDYSPELMEDFFSQANPLTDQENKLLVLAAQGLSNKEIAEKLFLSEGTVRNYMSVVFNKLEAANRTEAVKIAREKGFI